MSLIGYLLAVVAGWLGWSYWLCIPIGLLILVGVYRVYGEQKMQRVAIAGPVFAPLLALLLMWFGTLLPWAG